MQFNFRDSDYRIKYKARGIAWRGKIGVDVSDCKTTEEAIVKAKLKNLRTGSIAEYTFNAGIKVPTAHVEKQKMQFLYADGDNYSFMNMETYEQVELNKKQIENEVKYLKEGLEVIIIFFEGEMLGIELPEKISFKITKTEPGIKGNTATNATKDAIIETGMLVKVPLFIEQDEEISSTLQNLNVTGTRLIRNMIMVPIDNTILYVEPIYQVMLNESEVPVLRRVIGAVGNKVAIGNNLTEALRNLGSQSAINIEVSNTDDINSIIDEIIKANKNVENSTRNNDWDMVGSDMSTLQSLINRLDELVTEQRKQEEEENADNTVTDANTTVDDPSLVDMQAVNEIE